MYFICKYIAEMEL